MDADLDTLCTVIYCTADDLLPEARANARRRVTDAELVTLCVAQAIMGIPSDRRFLRGGPQAARPPVPGAAQPGRPTASAAAGWPTRSSGSWASSPRRARASATTCCSSTRPRCECAAQPRDGQALGARPTRPTTATAAATRAASGAFACTCWPRPTARRAPSRSPIPSATSARSALELLGARRARRRGARLRQGLRRARVRRRRPPSSASSSCARRARTSPAAGPHLAPIRQRIESIFWTCKDLLTLERHGARTLAGLRERILQRFLCLAACISLNHRLGRPSRALVDYCA